MTNFGYVCIYQVKAHITATWQRQSSVNGDWLWQWERAIFSQHPSTDHQKNCQRWLHQWTLQLYQIWCTSIHGGASGL